MSAVTLLMSLEEGSSLNKTCRVGGLPLPLLSPGLSLSKISHFFWAGAAWLVCCPPALAWLPSLGQDRDFMAPGEEHVQALSFWYQL